MSSIFVIISVPPANRALSHISRWTRCDIHCNELNINKDIENTAQVDDDIFIAPSFAVQPSF